MHHFPNKVTDLEAIATKGNWSIYSNFRKLINSLFESSGRQSKTIWDRLDFIIGTLKSQGHTTIPCKSRSRSELLNRVVLIYSILRETQERSNTNYSVSINKFGKERLPQYSSVIVHERISKLISALEMLKPETTIINLHGSYGIGDPLDSWSDVDVFVVLKDHVFESPDNFECFLEKSIRINNQIRKIDPLSHHSLMIHTELDLNGYDGRSLPLELLEIGVNVHSPDAINYRRSKTFSEETQLGALAIYRHFSRIISNQNYPSDYYHLKNDISHILIWPVRYLALKGIRVDKRESFQRIGEFVDRDHLRILGVAEERRRQFRLPSRIEILRSFGVPSKIVRYMAVNLTSDKGLSSRHRIVPLYNDFLESSYKLIRSHYDEL